MRAHCPYCGEELEGGHECEKIGGWVGGGVCPMCSGPYESWLNHLKDCEPN